MIQEKEILEKTGHMYSPRTDRAWEKIREKAGIAPGQNKKTLPLLFKMAALFLLLAGLGWGIRWMVQSRWQTVQTAWNQQKVTLPDGSTAFLNGNSTLHFPEAFKGKSRVVKLRGEAFFEVKGNREKPFVVLVPEGKIEVVGTAFNVKTPEDGGKTEVLVQTGVVEVSGAGRHAFVLTLHRGEFGIIKNGKTVKAAPPRANYLSWHTKVIRFRKAPLSRVVDVINRAYAKNVVLAGEKLRQLELTSAYDHAGFETVLNSICLTFHLKAVKKGDKIVLYQIKE